MSRDEWIELLAWCLVGGPFGLYIFYKIRLEPMLKHRQPKRPALPWTPPRVDIETSMWGSTRLFRVCIDGAPYELTGLEHDILDTCWDKGHGLSALMRALDRVDAAHIIDTLEGMERHGLLLMGGDRRYYIHPNAQLAHER